ncbi:MAG: helix-turn-helix domain-containing protein, partial [Sneathiella sp.]
DKADEIHSCFPSVKSIATKTEMTERSVQKWLRFLCKNNLIQIKPRFKNGRQRSSRYYLQLDVLSVNLVHPSKGERDSPSGVNDVREEGEPDSPSGANQIHPEPSKEPSLEPLPPLSPPIDFWEVFEKAYPDRGGQELDLAGARRIFDTLLLDGEDPEQIVGAVRNYNSSTMHLPKHKRDTIQKAVTFLRKETWREYIPKGAPDINLGTGIGDHAAGPWQSILEGWPDQDKARAWLYPLKLTTITNQQVTLAAASEFNRSRIVQDFGKALEKAFKHHLPDLEKFEITVEGKN